MKKIALFLVIAVFFSFTSCDNFFSTSWGTPRDFNPDNIDVNAENIDAWINLAVGNPALAAAIAERIILELRRTDLSSSDRAKLINGGVMLTIEASGIGTSLIVNAAGLLSDLLDDDTEFDGDMMKNKFNNIQGDFKDGGVDAANQLAEIASGGVMPGQVPGFSEEYAAMAHPSDVGQAVMVLLLAELDDVDDWNDVELDSIDSRLDGIVLGVNDEGESRFMIDESSNTPPSTNTLVLAAYLNLIADGDERYENNMLTGPMKGMFF